MISVLSSCKDDDNCYECDAYTLAGVAIPAATICEGDSYTATELDAAVAAAELAGATCTKK